MPEPEVFDELYALVERIYPADDLIDGMHYCTLGLDPPKFADVSAMPLSSSDRFQAALLIVELLLTHDPRHAKARGRGHPTSPRKVEIGFQRASSVLLKMIEGDKESEASGAVAKKEKCSKATIDRAVDRWLVTAWVMYFVVLPRERGKPEFAGVMDVVRSSKPHLVRSLYRRGYNIKQ